MPSFTKDFHPGHKHWSSIRIHIIAVKSLFPLHCPLRLRFKYKLQAGAESLRVLILFYYLTHSSEQGGFMKALTAEMLRTAAQAFDYEGSVADIRRESEGHINDTRIVTVQHGDTKVRYILQRINTDIFLEPDKLMDNIVCVTRFLQKKIKLRGGDPLRETLTVITANGKPFYCDADSNWWRSYYFIENTICYDQPHEKRDFYESGRAFGEFQEMLADFPAADLYSSIPDFHNTGMRFQQFEKAKDEDTKGRAVRVQAEIKALEGRRHYADDMTDAVRRLPVRVCHNDTKLSNVLFDAATGRALCVVDLDTIMPGSIITDFGDAIRFGASTAAEDEPDLSKVHFDISMYEQFRDGFLGACGTSLTQDELAFLPEGAKIITYEQALRFLTDYLQGDTYYHTSRPHQNLDRARTQIRLLEEMEKNTSW